MKHRKILVITIGAILIAACATSSKVVRSASALNQISVGYPKSEVLKYLGEPTSTSAKGSGSECLDYEFQRVGQSQYSTLERPHHVILKNGKVACYGEESCERAMSSNITIINGVRMNDDPCS